MKTRFRIPYATLRAGNRSSSDVIENQSGFTIVELMIATLVFSVVLMVITTGVISFSNFYYKGLNSSATQVATQGAVDNIVQSIQFSSVGTITSTDGTEGFFCAGNKLYVYTLGQQFTGNPAATTGLYAMDKGASCTNTPPSGGTELLAKNMRLTKISVSQNNPVANLWQVTLNVAYGDSDLLCDPSIGSPTTAGSCATNGVNYAANALVSGNSIICKAQVGSQFCSTSAVSNVTQQRIMSN